MDDPLFLFFIKKLWLNETFLISAQGEYLEITTPGGLFKLFKLTKKTNLLKNDRINK